jgi:hypothetical protein
LPIQTSVQTRSICRAVKRPLAQAITISASPVKSCAPPTTTRTSPIENTSPASRRVTP